MAAMNTPAPAGKPAPPGRPKDMAKRASILTAASKLFVQHGYGGVSMDQIAAEAGVAPVTLATAWSKQHDFVASTIVGATREDQLDDIFAAMDLTLSKEVMDAINKVSKEILYPMG